MHMMQMVVDICRYFCIYLDVYEEILLLCSSVRTGDHHIGELLGSYILTSGNSTGARELWQNCSTLASKAVRLSKQKQKVRKAKEKTDRKEEARVRLLGLKGSRWTHFSLPKPTTGMKRNTISRWTHFILPKPTIGMKRNTICGALYMCKYTQAHYVCKHIPGVATSSLM